MFGVLMYLLLVSEVIKRKNLKSVFSNGNHSTKPGENHLVVKADKFISDKVGTMAKRLRYFTTDPKTTVGLVLKSC